MRTQSFFIVDTYKQFIIVNGTLYAQILSHARIQTLYLRFSSYKYRRTSHTYMWICTKMVRSFFFIIAIMLKRKVIHLVYAMPEALVADE